MTTASGKPQLLGRQLVVGDLPQHHRDETALLENRDAKPSQVAKGESKVGTARFLQFPLATLRRDALHQRHRVFGFQRLRLQLSHATVQSKDGRLADDDVNIAGTLLDRSLQAACR